MQAISTLRTVRALCIAVLFSWACAVPAFAQATAPLTSAMQRTQVPVTSIAGEGGVNSVTFSGQVTIASRLARDTDFGRHQFVMVIDMSGLTGTRGRTTFRTAYQEEFVKPHAANQNIEFVFPVTVETEALLSQVLTGIARVAFNVDLDTGTITSATVTVASR